MRKRIEFTTGKLTDSKPITRRFITPTQFEIMRPPTLYPDSKIVVLNFDSIDLHTLD